MQLWDLDPLFALVEAAECPDSAAYQGAELLSSRFYRFAVNDGNQIKEGKYDAIKDSCPSGYRRAIGSTRNSFEAIMKMSGEFEG